MTLEELWRRITAAIPSRHLAGELAAEPFGIRLALARTAMAHHGRLRYLEVGVRRGHSLAFVAGAAQLAGLPLEALGVDPWVADYGGEPNHGAAYVLERLEELGLDAGVRLATGSSHDVLPELEDGSYHLIHIDGDHTPAGALEDLEDGWRLLEAGGVLMFDDLVDELEDVWRGFLASKAHEFADAGAGEAPGAPAWGWVTR